MSRAVVQRLLSMKGASLVVGGLVVWGLALDCDSRPVSQGAPAKTRMAPQAAESGAHPGPPPDDARRTASGLVSQVLQVGRGDQTPKATDEVRVHCLAWNEKGKLTKDTRKDGKPLIFDVSGVIDGLSEGLQLMKVGERRRLWIPDALAYPGRPGAGPRPDLVYDIELLEILEGRPPALPAPAVERRPEPPRAPADVAAPPRGAKKTSSGLAYRVLARGKGKVRPGPTSRVKIHYSGWTTEGELFDSSVVRGHPVAVPLDRVIAGWAEGLSQMVPGDKRLFWIPEDLAYQGRPGSPPGMLVYEIELLKVLP